MSRAEETALLALAAEPPDRTTRYGGHPSQVVDHYLPDGGLRPDPARPRVTILHGGYWREAYDRTHVSPLAAALAREGMAVALAEYRRVGGGGGWPATFEDVERLVATAWAGTGSGRAAALARDDGPPGGNAVPPGGPHVLLGHSAGGHLALWAAARAAQRNRRDDPPAFDRVVAVAPVADLGRAHALGLSDGAVAGLLGGPDAVAELLPLVDPLRLPPPAVPVTLLHGTDDPDVPPTLSRAYAEAARRAGGDVTLWEQPGTGHFAALTPARVATGPYADLLAALRGAPRPA